MISQMGQVAKGKGVHSNNLMEIHTNPVTGANCYSECKVRVRPAWMSRRRPRARGTGSQSVRRR